MSFLQTLVGQMAGTSQGGQMTIGVPVYPSPGGGYTLTPPQISGSSSSSMYVGNGGFFGNFPPHLIPSTPSSSSNVFFPAQTITQNLNTPLGNFTSSVQIPENAVVPPPSQCNDIIKNVSNAIPSMIQNTIQPASSVIAGVESAL